MGVVSHVLRDPLSSSGQRQLIIPRELLWHFIYESRSVPYFLDWWSEGHVGLLKFKMASFEGIKAS